MFILKWQGISLRASASQMTAWSRRLMGTPSPAHCLSQTNCLKKLSQLAAKAAASSFGNRKGPIKASTRATCSLCVNYELNSGFRIPVPYGVKDPEHEPSTKLNLHSMYQVLSSSKHGGTPSFDSKEFVVISFSLGI